MTRLSSIILAALLLAAPGRSRAEEIRVATASNFRSAMTELASVFEQASGYRVVAIYGSSGKHFAQIINGAPFDAFFAADAMRPQRLEQEGLAVAGSRFTYATGRLVLWSPRPGYVDGKGHILSHGDFSHLAVANPELAPYGAAARDTLESLDLWQSLGNRLVLGENIGQTLLFIHSGNAELGFVAWSQIIGDSQREAGSYWQVPEHLHRPIRQQAVLLRDKAPSRAFMSFIRGEEAARIIHAHGYATDMNDLP